METLYSILRPRGLGHTLLLSATTLEEARAFMRANGFVKTTEKHFPESALTHWVVQ